MNVGALTCSRIEGVVKSRGRAGEPGVVVINEVALLSEFLTCRPTDLLLCTYTLDLGFLERELLDTLIQKYDTKVHIVVSSVGYSASLHDQYSLGSVGTGYLLTRIADYPVAFHPKVFLSIEPGGGFRLYSGGCNFTYPGTCLNLDAVDCIDSDSLSEASKSNLISFLESIRGQSFNSKAIEHLNRCIQTISQVRCRSSDSEFLHSCERSIGEQIFVNVGDSVQRLRVVSPFFDGDMSGLDRLVRTSGCRDVAVLVNANDFSVNLHEMPPGVAAMVPGIAPQRRLHAKIYLFYGKVNFYCFVGSANCTNRGLWARAKPGNYEAGILRRLPGAEDLDAMFEFYKPKLVRRQSFWEYIPRPPTSTAETEDYLSFEVEVEFGQLRLHPIGVFPEALEGILTLAQADGSVRQIVLDHPAREEDGTFLVPIPAGAISTEGPCRVIVETHVHPRRRGECWLMQNLLLSRNLAVRKLIGGIRQLARDFPDGWNALGSIITFVANNMFYLNGGAQNGLQSGHRVGGAGHEGMPVVSEVVESDQVVTTIDGSPFRASNYRDIRTALSALILGGLQPTGNDESGTSFDDLESGETGTSGGFRSREQEVQRYEAIQAAVEETRRTAFEALPDLKEIFSISLISPVRVQLRTRQWDSASFLAFYATLSNTVTFCLRLSRFIRVELAARLSQSAAGTKTPPLRENRDVVLQFLAVTHFGVLRQLTQPTELSAVAIDAGALGEIGLFLLECWLLDLDRSFGRVFFLRAFSVLVHVCPSGRLQQLIVQLLADEGRFDPERMNVFIRSAEVAECIESITKSRRREERYAPLFERHLKCSLLFNQMIETRDSIRSLESKSEPNLSLIAYYRSRIERLRQQVTDLEKNGPGELKGRFDARLHEIDKCIGLDELDFTSGFARCPVCQTDLSASIPLLLKAFRPAECPGCKSLLVPIHVDRETPGFPASAQPRDAGR